MPGGMNIMDLCSRRILRHQEESRFDKMEKWNAIERLAASLATEDNGDDDERPFMIPSAHNPYDIWYSIFDIITDHKEIVRLWEGCPFFRDFLSLKQKYVQARLPQIFQILLEKRPKILLEEERMWVSWRDKVKWRRTLLNLRLVSKVCKNSVEGLLQDADPKKGKYFVTLKTTEQVWKIIDSILGKEITTYTFFPQNVEVRERNPQFDEGFAEAVGVFLELVGKHVKTFNYKSMDTVQRVYGKLSEWVLYMPSLENVELSPLRWRGRWVRDDIIPGFEGIPAFPNCPKLRCCVQLYDMLPKPYVQHILQANPLINAISLPERVPIAQLLDPAELNSTHQRLQSLHTPMFAPLLSYLDFQWHLKKLVLDGPYRFHASSQELFTFLHQFRDSLEHFEMRGMEVEMTDNCFLDLPLLRFITWRNETFRDLRFLMHAGRLEEIQVAAHWPNITYPESFSDGFFMKVTNGFDGLSIWDIFPRLQKVTVVENFEYTQESIQQHRHMGIAFVPDLTTSIKVVMRS